LRTTDLPRNSKSTDTDITTREKYKFGLPAGLRTWRRAVACQTPRPHTAQPRAEGLRPTASPRLAWRTPESPPLSAPRGPQGRTNRVPGHGRATWAHGDRAVEANPEGASASTASWQVWRMKHRRHCPAPAKPHPPGGHTASARASSAPAPHPCRRVRDKRGCDRRADRQELKTSAAMGGATRPPQPPRPCRAGCGVLPCRVGCGGGGGAWRRCVAVRVRHKKTRRETVSEGRINVFFCRKTEILF